MSNEVGLSSELTALLAQAEVPEQVMAFCRKPGRSEEAAAYTARKKWHTIQGLACARALYRPVLERLRPAFEADPSPNRRHTMGFLLLSSMMQETDRRLRQKYLDQFRRCYGHDSSTINLEDDRVPLKDRIERERRWILANVPEIEVVEGKVVERTTPPSNGVSHAPAT